MGNIVDLIDEMNGNTWSFKPKRNRVIKKKKPLEEKIREQEERERQEREVLRAIEKMMGGGGIDSGRSSVDSLLDTPRTLKLLGKNSVLCDTYINVCWSAVCEI